MLTSQKLAIAAHLHVLLRRKTGRVTDTEWMAGNLDYAREVVRFARAKALEDGHVELTEWADKLERAMLEPTPQAARPLVQAAVQLLRERGPAELPAPQAPVGHSDFGQSTFGHAPAFAESGFERKPKEPDAPRYVGGIR
jgi:hypothetical protein